MLNFGSCASCNKFLQYVSTDDLIKAIMKVKRETRLENVYLATDCPDKKLIQFVINRTGAKVLEDSPHGRKVLTNSIELRSAIEQGICVHGAEFVGTSYSTWSTVVWQLRSHNSTKRALLGMIDLLASHKSPLLVTNKTA